MGKSWNKEQEAEDRKVLRQTQLDEKLGAIDYMLHCHRNGIAHTGYGTFESLCAGTVTELQARLDKLVRDHVRKYPD